MKTIMCYGDSNTWGFNPEAYDFETGEFDRYPYDVRWTGRLSAILGDGHRIVEEGYNGRTTVFEDPIRPGRCALSHFPVSFYSHEPLDLIVLMLGANDLKDVYAAQASVVGMGLERLIRELRYVIPSSLSRDVKLLVVSPPELLPLNEKGEYYSGFSAASQEKSRRLPAIYEKIAERYQCGFLNAASFVSASPIDGLHLNAASHARFAEVIAAKTKEMMV
ncbi:MAG: GDSL-type esterase/lipase family protein [Synergistaceae bacterium]|jgi:lysophospholipase L1-like esterase|nr:GDSL-type esterase/lipase family protein [Synergistaceae bacterium]